MGIKESAAEKIKKLEETIAKKKAELVREKGRLSEKARKERTRQLIQVGGLADIAGLTDEDRGFLLGFLLNAKKITTDSPEWRALKALGDSVLRERQAAKKKVAAK